MTSESAIPPRETAEWHADILGNDFDACAFRAQGPDGVERIATLVRHVPRVAGSSGPALSPRDVPEVDGTLRAGPGPARAVLFLHGWSDYFFNTELAEFWTRSGFHFFALDLHNHGRSLRPDTHGGYVADLADYDAEITEAIGIINSLRREGAPRLVVTLMGHSTGGLVAALWASRHPGMASHLILNSPWLEMHGSPAVRRATRTLLGPLAWLRPESVIRLPERGFYWRSISSSAEGEWTLNDEFRPPHAFPVRAGWLSAVLAGQARVARGLNLEIPILVLISGASANGMVWKESMRSTDAVLDVNTIALRSLGLGRSVTLERIDGALHDVFLSAPRVRKDAYSRLARWIRAYALDEGA
jgi:alpha-beta hydrolase superfamily lysophospholipase